MNQRFIIILLLLGINFALAAKKKEYPRADIKVSYNYHFLNVRNDGEPMTQDYNYILLANTDQSKYYNRNNEYLDSLESTPQGRKLSKELMSIGIDRYRQTGDDSAIPRHKGHLYVFKSRPDKTTSVYDAYGLMERGVYTEPFSEFEWHISDSTKTILGYECIMAESDYHGRHWTVWFAPDIPVQDGPWKLCGLPGLILKASESDGQHSFTATGIEISDQEILPIYQPKNYDKLNRIEMLKAYAAYRKNSDAYARAIIMDSPDGSSPDIKAPATPSAPVKYIDFLETDYHDDL